MIWKRTPDRSRHANSPRNGGGPFAPWATARRLTREQWLYLPRLFSKREKIRLTLLVAVAALAAAGLAVRLVTRVTVERPAAGGVLREGALAEPRFVNPIYASNDTDRDLSTLVFAKLIRFGENGAMAKDLAEEVEISPDGKIYTVRLRPGVSWHDGEPLTTEDVAFTVRTIQDPEYQSPLRANWQGVSVEKLNDQTVRFTLRQPYAPFIENLALGIIPAHLWRKVPRESAILSDLNLKPVGSGPYRFQKFTRREDGTITSMTVVRNRRYHLEGPYLEAAHFTFYADEAQLIAAYRRNDIDSFAFASRAHRQTLDSLDAAIHELKPPKVFAVFLNPGAQATLGRPKVRQALAMAIDREAIISRTVAGGGVVVSGPLPAAALSPGPNLIGDPYDPDGARNLIAADGWKDANGDGTLERTEGSGRRRETKTLEVRLVTSDAPELAAAAELIAEMWRAVGVRTETKTLPIADLEATMIRPRAYEALLFGEVYGHEPDPFAFWHTSQLKDPGLNVALYSNRRVDQLLEEARRTGDPRARVARYNEFQRIVASERGAIFLYRPTNYYALRRTFRGAALGAVTLAEERFDGIHRWYQETRRALR